VLWSNIECEKCKSAESEVAGVGEPESVAGKSVSMDVETQEIRQVSAARGLPVYKVTHKINSYLS